MQISPAVNLEPGALVGPPANYLQLCWYAAYTCANHEKSVALQLGQRGVEHFLPVYESVRRWKDRRVKLELPLFPGYTFVRIALRDRLEVLQVPGVVRLVGFNGSPTPLGDEEIERLRRGLGQGVRAEPHPFLMVGRRVQITTGPLAGYEGILLRRKGSLRVVLSIEPIQRSISVEVDAANLTPQLSLHSVLGSESQATIQVRNSQEYQ